MGRGAFKVSARTLGTPIGIMVTDPLRRAAAWRGDSCAARKAAAGAISSVSSAWKSMVSADAQSARLPGHCGGWHLLIPSTRNLGRNTRVQCTMQAVRQFRRRECLRAIPIHHSRPTRENHPTNPTRSRLWRRSTRSPPPHTQQTQPRQSLLLGFSAKVFHRFINPASTFGEPRQIKTPHSPKPVTIKWRSTTPTRRSARHRRACR